MSGTQAPQPAALGWPGSCDLCLQRALGTLMGRQGEGLISSLTWTGFVLLGDPGVLIRWRERVE